MLEQFIDGIRRASESSLHAQQDFLKSFSNPWFGAAPSAAPSTESSRVFHKRFLELSLEMLNKHREAVDAVYRVGIQAFDEAFRVNDSKSPEEYRRAAEEIWRKLFDSFRALYEAQLQELQKLTAMSFDMAQGSPG